MTEPTPWGASRGRRDFSVTVSSSVIDDVMDGPFDDDGFLQCSSRKTLGLTSRRDSQDRCKLPENSKDGGCILQLTTRKYGRVATVICIGTRERQQSFAVEVLVILNCVKKRTELHLSFALSHGVAKQKDSDARKKIAQLFDTFSRSQSVEDSMLLRPNELHPHDCLVCDLVAVDCGLDSSLSAVQPKAPS